MHSPPSFNSALITGSFSGLGKALADRLEAQGIEVIRTGSAIHDLTDKESLDALIELIKEKTPDLLVNNAGVGLYGPTLSHAIEEEMDLLDVNIKAVTRLTLEFVKALMVAKKPGTILNISSAGAFFPYPNFNLYCASKAFVNHFSLALNSELKSQNIRVLCACPGQIATPFRIHASKGYYNKLDAGVMPVAKAVDHLLFQLKHQKPLYVFDWRTRFMIYIARLLPRPFLEKILLKGLKDRIP